MEFNDHFDIVSMSIGNGFTDGTDPMSQAVNSAVDKGIVVVVAAGNADGMLGTVTAPGTAEKAITVGASYKYDELTLFSSRGPVDSRIKPDVVAPGFKICAARSVGSALDSFIKQQGWEKYYFLCDDDDYYALSGTSMATPMVAGAVALILQAHPTWTPEMVKAALKENSEELPWHSVYLQGSGRIDSYKR